MNGAFTKGNAGEIPASAFRPPRKIKVFILEDEPIAQQLYSDLLTATSNQFQIRKFSDGDEAWNELTKTDPDLLIMDVFHPGLDGLEILNLLAVERVAYPILVITGDSPFGDFYKNCYPDLKLSVLGKPFRIQAFYAQLAGLFREANAFVPPPQKISTLARGGGVAALMSSVSAAALL